ncbi:MAG: glycosyltransferase family 2 protein [Chloroflexota bacterium]
MSQGKVVVVILNWNQAGETVACIDSLHQQTYANLELLVVENCSTDDSVNTIRRYHPTIQLVQNGRNAGFAGGMNLGIKYALANQADWVFVINNDTLFDPLAIQTLLNHAEQSVGLLAPVIYYEEGDKLIWSHGGNVSQTLLEVETIGRGTTDSDQYPPRLEVDFVPGCAMLISRQVLEVVGGFDERFFMYYEDSDLCLRIRQAGFQILTIFESKMWHKVAVSSGGSDSPNERYWMAHSSVQFFAKHGRFPQIILISLWRLGSAVKTTVRLLAQRKISSLSAYWQGLLAGVRFVLDKQDPTVHFPKPRT